MKRLYWRHGAIGVRDIPQLPRLRDDGGFVSDENSKVPKPRLHDQKLREYFERDRPEVREQVRGSSLRVCDVGCGAGVLLAALRDEGKLVEAVGIEVDEDAAVAARRHADNVIIGDAATLDLPYPDGYFDHIIFADVLEHLADPWAVLKRFRHLVKDDGRIVVSVPNVRHWSVLWPLVWRGHWEYRAEGILDATHLRFFTRGSAVELVRSAHFRPLDVSATVYGKRARLLDRLTGGLLRDLLAYQFVIVAAPAPTLSGF